MASGELDPRQRRLVLLGSVDEGKRSVGNTILGREVFGSQKTVKCVEKAEWVAGGHVTVINTPGWGRDQRCSQTPVTVQEQLLQSVFPPGVHAVLLVIRADKPFTEAHRVALQDHMEFLGGNIWNHTVVVFTFADWLGSMPIEDFIFSEGQALQWVVERCEYKYVSINNNARADISQVIGLLELIERVAGYYGVFQLDEERCQREAERMIAQKKARAVMEQRVQEARMRWGAGQPPRCASREEAPNKLSQQVTSENNDTKDKSYVFLVTDFVVDIQPFLKGARY